jgi:ELWxxDGT repeat protein
MGGGALAGIAAATPPVLVRDIDSRRATASGLPAPHSLVAVGGKVVFLASEYSSGTELWVTDGTAHGTQMLLDSCPGVCSSPIALLGSNARHIFFQVGVGLGQLWRTDGTRAGTVLLVAAQDIRESFGTAVAFLGRPGGAYFRACTGGLGCELWTTDGTAAGTYLLADLVPGSGSSNPRGFTMVGGALFFAASGAAGPGLWRSDGTAAGTRLVKALPPGHVEPYHLVAVGQRVVFVAGGGNGELWVSDGTAAGTRALTGLVAADPFGFPAFLLEIDAVAYVLATDVTGGTDLWQSDGTPAGTRRMTDLGDPAPFRFGFRGSQMAKLGETVLFVASDGLNGYRVWTSRGTPQTTAVLSGCPGGCPQLLGDEDLFVVGNRVLFLGSDERAVELWATDGSGEGTRLVRDFCPGACEGILHDLAVAAGGL